MNKFEKKIEDLKNQILNLQEGEIVITLSDGEGNLIPLAMNADQKIAIDCFIKASSKECDFLKTPFSFKLKQ